MASDAALPQRRQVRYEVRWRRLSELVAVTAATAVWAAFLIRGG